MSIAEVQPDKGSKVEVFLSRASELNLTALFQEFTDEDYSFNKTMIRIKLFERGEVFMSRSQAKRVVNGLDKFNHIVFDFHGVRTVGQAFADEIFRVFANKYPAIKISAVGANSSIDFMISRARN